MAAPLSPAKQLANGRQSFWLVDTISNISAPTATEINAGLNITGYLMDDYEGVTVSGNKVTLPGVMLENTTTEINGETTISAADLRCTIDPQAANTSDAKKVWKKLYIDASNSWSGYLVERQNFAGSDGAATAGQYVNVSAVVIDNGVVLRTGTDAAGVWISQHAVSPSKYVPLVAVA
jgi:hypothetical protein